MNTTFTLPDYELTCWLLLCVPPYLFGGYWAYMLHHAA